MRTLNRAIVLLALVIGCWITTHPNSARAGGLYLSEFGTSAMSSASAGREAAADDAGIATHNPAAMTQIDGRALLLGLGVLYADVDFDIAPSSTVMGGSGGQAGGPGPLMNFSYVESITDRLKFGLAVYAPAAAMFDFNNDWAGRFALQDLALVTLSIAPSVAFQVTDWLSLGVGGTASWTHLELDVAAIGPGPIGFEGQVSLNNMAAWAGGWSLSALVEPLDQLRVGLVYDSGRDFELSGDVKITPVGLLSPILDLTMDYAQSVSLGLYYRPMDEVGLRASGGWQGWSSLENQWISLQGSVGPPITSSLPRYWRDTWFLAFGGDYQIGDNWTLLTGFRYDSSPVSDGNRTVDLAIDRQWRWSAGFMRPLSDTLTLGATFEYANYGDARLSQDTAGGRLTGEFGDYQIFFLNLTLAWNWKPDQG